MWKRSFKKKKVTSSGFNINMNAQPSIQQPQSHTRTGGESWSGSASVVKLGSISLVHGNTFEMVGVKCPLHTYNLPWTNTKNFFTSQFHSRILSLLYSLLFIPLLCRLSVLADFFLAIIQNDNWENDGRGRKYTIQNLQLNIILLYGIRFILKLEINSCT